MGVGKTKRLSMRAVPQPRDPHLPALPGLSVLGFQVRHACPHGHTDLGKLRTGETLLEQQQGV